MDNTRQNQFNCYIFGSVEEYRLLDRTRWWSDNASGFYSESTSSNFDRAVGYPWPTSFYGFSQPTNNQRELCQYRVWTVHPEFDPRRKGFFFGLLHPYRIWGPPSLASYPVGTEGSFHTAGVGRWPLHTNLVPRSKVSRSCSSSPPQAPARNVGGQLYSVYSDYTARENVITLSPWKLQILSKYLLRRWSTTKCSQLHLGHGVSNSCLEGPVHQE
jgi:hypothetical protein